MTRDKQTNDKSEGVCRLGRSRRSVNSPAEGRLEPGAWIGLVVLLGGAAILAALVVWLMG